MSKLDQDELLDYEDNCPATTNPSQENNYGGVLGDACEDSDMDGYLDTNNCPVMANPSQSNQYGGDSSGDACSDVDGDSIVDSDDNCPETFNPSQENSLGHGSEGDHCETLIMMGTLTTSVIVGR